MLRVESVHHIGEPRLWGMGRMAATMANTVLLPSGFAVIH